MNYTAEEKKKIRELVETKLRGGEILYNGVTYRGSLIYLFERPHLYGTSLKTEVKGHTYTKYKVEPDGNITHEDEIIEDERYDDYEIVEVPDVLESYLRELGAEDERFNRGGTQ
tara:strand:- start:2146 stop:2487 length:342 start_codon:yes stop_codon:yes gene_type:complete